MGFPVFSTHENYST